MPFVDTVSGITSPRDQKAISVMMMYFRVGKTWTATCLSQDSNIIDDFVREFIDILSHVDNIVKMAPSHQLYGQPFSFKMGIIAPLSFTAGHCRHPHLCRKAIALSRRAPAQEALFTAEHSARAAENIVDSEEQPDLHNKMKAEICDGTLPRLSVRCHYVNVPFKEQVLEKRRVTMHYLRPHYSEARAQVALTRHCRAIYCEDSEIVT